MVQPSSPFFRSVAAPRLCSSHLRKLARPEGQTHRHALLGTCQLGVDDTDLCKHAISRKFTSCILVPGSYPHEGLNQGGDPQGLAPTSTGPN